MTKRQNFSPLRRRQLLSWRRKKPKLIMALRLKWKR